MDAVSLFGLGALREEFSSQRAWTAPGAVFRLPMRVACAILIAGDVHMLTLKQVDADSSEMPALTALMERAFPANERMPMDVLLSRAGSDMLAILEDGAFRGFINLLTRRDICHILFFAMEEDSRGRGLGTRTLALVRELKPGLRLIADLEAPEEGAPNAAQRLSRWRFYRRCGYEETGVTYRWRGERYAILSSGGQVTDEEFWQFWNEW